MSAAVDDGGDDRCWQRALRVAWPDEAERSEMSEVGKDEGGDGQVV
jgi:hypothetical protein